LKELFKQHFARTTKIIYATVVKLMDLRNIAWANFELHENWGHLLEVGFVTADVSWAI